MKNCNIFIISISVQLTQWIAVVMWPSALLQASIFTDLSFRSPSTDFREAERPTFFIAAIVPAAIRTSIFLAGLPITCGIVKFIYKYKIKNYWMYQFYPYHRHSIDTKHQIIMISTIRFLELGLT